MLSPLYTKLIGGAIGLLILGGLFFGLKHYKALAESRGATIATICAETRKAANQPKLKCGEVAAEIGFLGDALNAVRARTAAAQAADAAHAKEVESHDKIAGSESSHDYQAELARVRADYAERLRRAAAAANSSGGGKPSVSGITPSAGRPNGSTAQAGLPGPDALIATEQAIQLKAIQDWAKKVGLAH